MSAPPPEPFTYNALVARVVDGDTVDVVIDLGFGATMGRYDRRSTWIRLRLLGADAFETSLRGGTTPEERDKGREARVQVKEWMESKWVRVSTRKSKSTDAFGRWLAHIYFEDDDGVWHSLADRLILGGFTTGRYES